MSTSERLDIEAIVGDLDIACEVRRHTGDQPAAWVLWTRPCCEKRKARGFTCDPCLRHYLTTDRGVHCESCGERAEPARAWIVRFEPINSPAT